MTALTINEAERLAEQIRITYWNNGFPVDPVLVARELGARVIDVDLPDDIAGALLKKIDEDPIIMLRNGDSENRRRFTCAHEIGHYVFRLERGHFEEQEIDFVDKRSNLSGLGIDDEEVSANRFAAALLMPANEFKNLLSLDVNNYQLSSYFGVSVTAVNHRRNTLNANT